MITTAKQVRRFACGAENLFVRRIGHDVIAVFLPRGTLPPGDGWEPFESVICNTKIKAAPPETGETAHRRGDL